MKTRIPLIAAFLLVAQASLPVAVQAAVIPVSNTADSGLGSLREALASAGDGDTIDGSVISGTILLTSGELLVTNNLTIAGPGPNNLAVDGTAASRVFHIGSNTVVNISSLTITNGSRPLDSGGGIWNDHATLTVSNCTLSGIETADGGGIFNDGGEGSASLKIVDSTLRGNSAENGGGGIWNNGENGNATVEIVNSTLTGNSAENGGGIHNDGYGGSASLKIVNSTLTGNSGENGGGIFNDGAFDGKAILEIVNSTLSSNEAGVGGGIFNNLGTVSVLNSILSGNRAEANSNGLGGGIYNEYPGVVTVKNSTLSGNSVDGAGGGIFNYGDVSISNSTLKDNSAIFGGGIDNFFTLAVESSTVSSNKAEYGGGIESYYILTVQSSTLSGNSAFNGGGIMNLGTLVTVSNSTISGNLATGFDFEGVHNPGDGGGMYSYGGTLAISNSIIALNTAELDHPDILPIGSSITGTFNFFGQDHPGVDPLLGPLADNGGPTFTHALLCGSPCINAGDPEFAPPPDFDQRGTGFSRVANGRVDIGAFERQTACNNPPVAQCHDVTVSAGAHCTADASIDNGSSDPDAGDTITLSQDPPGPYGLGATSVTLTVTDSHGASSSCTATVTVVDDTPPQIDCPANIVTDATSPAGAVVSFAPTASDNCSVASVTSTPSSGSTFAIGTTTVTCRATDGAGLTSSCTFTIRVNGTTDADHDGVADAIDKCSDTRPGAIVNAKGCSIAQLVPCDGPLSGGKWKSHGQYVRAVIEAATDFLKAKLITRRQWVQIVTRAAWSRCGWNHRRDHDGDRDWHRNWDCDRDRDWGRGRDWGRD